MAPSTNKAQRALNRAHKHRDRIESLLADPWFRRHTTSSFLNFADGQLRKDCFHIYSKNERRVIDEVVEEMRPYSGFAGYAIGELIDLAVQCRSDCLYFETEKFIDSLNGERPTELPIWELKQLVNICRLRTSLPPFTDEFADPADLGDEEERQERAEAALERWASIPLRGFA